MSACSTRLCIAILVPWTRHHGVDWSLLYPLIIHIYFLVWLSFTSRSESCHHFPDSHQTSCKRASSAHTVQINRTTTWPLTLNISREGPVSFVQTSTRHSHPQQGLRKDRKAVLLRVILLFTESRKKGRKNVELQMDGRCRQHAMSVQQWSAV